MNNLKVSFIVPMYNTEKYILECLESIVKQEIEKEIIIINDGSTDDSLKVVTKFAKNYDFIRIINKENEGLSVARNVGLDNAIGEYICFIDSDDFLLDKCINSMYKIAKENDLDILRTFYSRFDDLTKEFSCLKVEDRKYFNKILNGKEFLKESIKSNIYEVTVVNGLFKTAFLKNNNILFLEGALYEDQLFTLKYLIEQDISIMQLNLVMYGYRQRNGSITKSLTLDNVDSMLKIVNEMNKVIENCELDKETYNLSKKVVSMAIYKITSMYGRLGSDDKEQVIKRIPKKILNQAIRYPFNSHEFFKVFLFTYLRIVVDLVYKFKEKKIKVGDVS